VFWLIVLVNISLAITYVTLGYQEVALLKGGGDFSTAVKNAPRLLNVFTAMTILTPWLSLVVLIDAQRRLLKCGGEDLTIDKNRMRAHLIAVFIVAVSQTFMVLYYYRYSYHHLKTNS
jgi:hypothetical protein